MIFNRTLPEKDTKKQVIIKSGLSDRIDVSLQVTAN